MAATFVPAPGMSARLRRSRLVGALMLGRAKRGAEAARSVAPVRTGAYRDSIKAVPIVEADGTQGAAIVAEDWKAGIIELGTSDTPAYAPLRRGAATS